MTLTNKVAQFDADSDLVNEWVHGGPTTSITTDSGPVRSPAKLIADNQSIFDAATLEATTLRSNLAAPGGASLLGYRLGSTGTATTVEAKLSEYVSVKDFGAVGDGSDDTAAIQSAIDAVGLAGGGFLYVPPGVYAISNTISIGNSVGSAASTYSGVKLIGSGAAPYQSSLSPTTFLWTGATDFDGAMIKVNGLIAGVEVSGIYLNGNMQVRDGLVIRSCIASRFSNILILNVRRYGVDLGVNPNGTASWYSTTNTFERVVSSPNWVSPAGSGYDTHAWHISGNGAIPADPHRNVFTACVGQVMGATGATTALPTALYLGYTDSSTFTECDFQLSRSHRLSDSAIDSSNEVGNWTGQTGVALHVDSTERSSFPLNNFFYGCSIPGGYLVTETGGNVVGTTIFTNQTTRDWESPTIHKSFLGFSDRGRYFGDFPIQIRGDNNGMRFLQQDLNRHVEFMYDTTSSGTDEGFVVSRTTGLLTTPVKTELLRMKITGQQEAKGFRSNYLAILDNAVAAITPVQNNGIVSFTRHDAGSNYSAVFGYDLAGSIGCTKLTSGGSANLVAGSGSFVAGNDASGSGSNGQVTLFAADDGVLRVINKAGFTIGVTLTFLC